MNKLVKEIARLLKQVEALQKQLAMKRTLLQICKEHLGKDATPDDLVPDTVACAITVSTLLNKLDATFPKVAGTWTLYDILAHRKDYKRLNAPEPETIVISPTGMGRKGAIGHVGIVGEGQVIMSNDSATGKFMQNYTVATWNARYRDKLGFPVLYFKKK